MKAWKPPEYSIMVASPGKSVFPKVNEAAVVKSAPLFLNGLNGAPTDPPCYTRQATVSVIHHAFASARRPQDQRRLDVVHLAVAREAWAGSGRRLRPG